MTNPIIKICGVKTPELASQAAKLGADFIGIVFHPPSERYVSLEQAKLIAQACKQAAAIAVGVFVNHTATQIADIIKSTGITMIQVHGQTSRQQHHLLPAKYPRIYVQTVRSEGLINPDIDNGLQYCDASRDFLLFDTSQPGKGRAFKWEKFSYIGPFRHGLAGGLNAENVRLAIEKIQPLLLDLSSGVENASGEKDCALIEEFIQLIK